MSRVRCQARLRMKLESPFLSRGLTAAGFGIDLAQARNADGTIILPGDMILGNLRQAFRDLAIPDADLFGQVSADEGDSPGSNARRRGHIVIGDLVAQTPEEKDKGGAITRVKIDDSSGSVDHGALAVVELPYPLGQEVEFSGTVVFWPDADKSQAVFADLQAALALIPAVGALKSVGFGWVEQASLEMESQSSLDAAQPKQCDYDRAALTLSFDRPFLVDAQRVADNVFQGATVVPGAVLKGALARRLERAKRQFDDALSKQFNDALSKVVFGHAFPAHQGARVLPLSVATDRNGQCIDFLLDDTPRLINGAVPQFAPDWKDGNAVRAALGWPAQAEFAYDTRTRTAINPETGTSAESQLFSYAAVIAGDCRWQCVVDRGDADKSAFATLLAMLEQGLDGIGKTGAQAQISMQAADIPTARALPGGQWALSLSTPALLNDPQALRDGRSLFDDYARYWHDKVGATLVRFFARQRLAGGYLGMRFRRDDTPYQPFLLTEPGSVFLLEGDCGDRLNSLLRRNLPPRPDNATWSTCPFMPENGYGAFHLTEGAPHV